MQKSKDKKESSKPEKLLTPKQHLAFFLMFFSVLMVFVVSAFAGSMTASVFQLGSNAAFEGPFFGIHIGDDKQPDLADSNPSPTATTGQTGKACLRCIKAGYCESYTSYSDKPCKYDTSLESRASCNLLCADAKVTAEEGGNPCDLTEAACRISPVCSWVAEGECKNKVECSGKIQTACKDPCYWDKAGEGSCKPIRNCETVDPSECGDSNHTYCTLTNSTSHCEPLKSSPCTSSAMQNERDCGLHNCQWYKSCGKCVNDSVSEEDACRKCEVGYTGTDPTCPDEKLVCRNGQIVCERNWCVKCNSDTKSCYNTNKISAIDGECPGDYYISIDECKQDKTGACFNSAANAPNGKNCGPFKSDPGKTCAGAWTCNRTTGQYECDTTKDCSKQTKDCGKDTPICITDASGNPVLKCPDASGSIPEPTQPTAPNITPPDQDAKNCEDAKAQKKDCPNGYNHCQKSNDGHWEYVCVPNGSKPNPTQPAAPGVGCINNGDHCGKGQQCCNNNCGPGDPPNPEGPICGGKTGGGSGGDSCDGACYCAQSKHSCEDGDGNPAGHKDCGGGTCCC